MPTIMKCHNDRKEGLCDTFRVRFSEKSLDETEQEKNKEVCGYERIHGPAVD